MWDKIKSWFSRNFCIHHWHEVSGTRRKIKTKRLLCAEWPDDKKKYAVSYGWDKYYIRYKHLLRCCKCNVKIIETASSDNFDEIMSYPDIDDEPLEL